MKSSFVTDRWLLAEPPAGAPPEPDFWVYLVPAADTARLGELVPDMPSWLIESLKTQLQQQSVARFVGPDVQVVILKVEPATVSGYDFKMGRDLSGKLAPDLGYAQHLGVVTETWPADFLIGFFSGLTLARYSYKARKLKPEAFTWITAQPQPQALLNEAQALGASHNLARYLIDSPPNAFTPLKFADFVAKIFAQSRRSNPKVTVYDADQLKKLKMGLILAVGQGSPHPPCLVKVQYRGRTSRSGPASQSAAADVVVVGKGVLFDTGGHDLKPSQYMRLMKKDMGGAAVAVSLMQWAQAMELKLNLDVYLPLVENSISATAMRPSDIYHACDGQSVEIHNTDAEGRLILADVLAHLGARQKSPGILIDVATLTGAAKVALGRDIAALFGNDAELNKNLVALGQRTGDWVWELPLHAGYSRKLESQFADWVNADEGPAGAITAALFLEKFIKSGWRWGHLDVYAWQDAPAGVYRAGGGRAQSLDVLVHFLKQLTA